MQENIDTSTSPSDDANPACDQDEDTMLQTYSDNLQLWFSDLERSLEKATRNAVDILDPDIKFPNREKINSMSPGKIKSLSPNALLSCGIFAVNTNAVSAMVSELNMQYRAATLTIPFPNNDTEESRQEYYDTIKNKIEKQATRAIKTLLNTFADNLEGEDVETAHRATKRLETSMSRMNAENKNLIGRTACDTLLTTYNNTSEARILRGYQAFILEFLNCHIEDNDAELLRATRIRPYDPAHQEYDAETHRKQIDKIILSYYSQDWINKTLNNEPCFEIANAVMRGIPYKDIQSKKQHLGWGAFKL